MTIGIIYCYTNKIDGKKYVGQTINPNQRRAAHKYEAKRNHYQTHFYRAMRKYGYDNFEYEILCECEDLLLNEKEQHHIQELRTFDENIGYNQRLGHVHMPSARKKISEAHHLRFSNMTPEEIAIIIEPMRRSNLGRPRTESQIEGTRKANQRNWVVTDPKGNEYRVTNLKRFCIKNGLTQSNMAAVQSGRYTHHKGWKCHKIE